MSIGRSRTERPEGAPYEWHLFEDGQRQPLVQAELEAAWSGVTPSEEIHRKAEIYELIDFAAEGRVNRPEELKDVARAWDLFELRWSFGKREKWRMYHAEPAAKPRWLVALRFHRKVTSGGNAMVKASQDAHMDIATDRYAVGAPWSWGPELPLS